MSTTAIEGRGITTAPQQKVQPKSESAKLFSHIYNTCLPTINQILHCRRTKGPDDMECKLISDDIWECYAKSVCPMRYEKAKTCVRAKGAQACQPEIKDLDTCAQQFLHFLASPKVVEVVKTFSASEANCDSERNALRQCISDVRDKKQEMKVCSRLDENMKDCYLKHLFPKEFTAYNDCLMKNPKEPAKCDEFSAAVDKAFASRGKKLLSALEFSQEEIDGQHSEDYQTMTFQILSAAASYEAPSSS